MRQQEPLTREELERLGRQERLVTRVHAVGLGVLVLVGIAAYSYRDTSWVRGLFLGALGAMAAAAAVVQLMGDARAAGRGCAASCWWLRPKPAQRAASARATACRRWIAFGLTNRGPRAGTACPRSQSRPLRRA